MHYNKSITEQIENMLRAYYPVLYLTSFEYVRTKQKMQGIISKIDKEYKYYEWNSVDGFGERDIKSGRITYIENLEDPEEVLKHIDSRINEDVNELYILEDFHEYINERNIKVRLRKLAESLRFYRKHIVILSSILDLPVELEKYITVIEIPLPDRIDIEKVLNQVAKNAKVALDNNLKKKLIDAAIGMTVMEADLAYCLAAVKDNFGPDSPRIVSFEKEQIIKKSGMLDYYQANESLKNVGGLENLKQWLEKRKKAFDFEAQNWGLKEPKGLLLLGVPGCGKSLTAKCIASLWNMPLLKLDMGKVFQAEVGSSESNIRRAIMTAEAVAPCVLWIDEIEKGIAGTQGSSTSDGGTSSRIFSTILTWMQEKVNPVFVVATANDISQLPPELLRKGRFDEIFFVDLPTKEERTSIFSIHLTKNDKNPAEFAVEKLAETSSGFNGAEIEECIKEAMFSAYSENPGNPSLKIKHILDAINETVPLSRTMNEQITYLRKWANSRAKKAGEDHKEAEEKIESVPLTKAEREMNRSFD